MRTTTADMIAHLGGEVTQLATCWRVRRRDGVTLGFTTHDQSLRIGGLTYRPSSAFSPTVIAAGQMFDSDDLDVEGALSDSAINAADLRAGLYDFAAVDLFLVNWAAPESGNLHIKSGWIGEVRMGRGTYVAELRGLTTVLRQSYATIYSAECSADLGDKHCRVDLETLTVSGSVIAVADRRLFTASALGKPDGYFAYGRLRWRTGQNAGRGIEVKTQAGNIIGLFDAMAGEIAVGDLFSISPGCDKRFATCRTKFANVANYRGHPHVPGMDAMLAYPGLT
ncbi:DUF2163 domain-containing protein [Govanella unica]|uniref:DUF2163 domain-containing protein n=1 Tax=Govanella unica TaxID=2975056 RepID=A0A9X3Z842_9PROT|nr:DUF2163 domain-containing protein [Govania unica]MDA5194955.1 DUF2163 domain-containing protein [Govania unica]